MEQALYISTIENLKYYTPDFKRLYFGNETCQRRIPSRKTIEKAMLFAKDNGMAFTYVTPYVTNEGLQRLEENITSIWNMNHEAEIVFNDWGVVQFMKETGCGLTRVMGRLLNKTKRGPRIMNILEAVPEETRAFYQGTNLTVPSACAFLLSNRVTRVEFDNTLQGVNLTETDHAIHKSLYIPFVFVSTTRFCLTAHCDKPEEKYRFGITACGRECDTYTFTLENPVMRVPLIRKGNTVYYVNETIPDLVGMRLVDRIVVQPEIPL